MYVQGIDFYKAIPKVSGRYLVMTEEPNLQDDEYYCTPTLVKIHAGKSTTWIQHSQLIYETKIYPHDWHPIAENCGWWFSKQIQEINFI